MSGLSPVQPPFPPDNLILVGFMGSGKTTVGRRLARALQWRFVDIDRQIEADAGKSIPDIFESEGEEGFRSRERQALEKTLRRTFQVIACGGGIVTRPENIERLNRGGHVFCLRASLATLRGRVGKDPNRPLAAKFETLYTERKPLYDSFANQVDTDAGDQKRVVREILHRLQRQRAAKVPGPARS
jgi:shikimate kinase